MRKYKIPTADATICNSTDEARAALKKTEYPAVIKVEGLAGGKGVWIAKSRKEADEYLHLIFEEKKFGNAANRILIEEYLTGEEVSFMVITDGKKFAPLAPAQYAALVQAKVTPPLNGDKESKRGKKTPKRTKS